MIPNEEKEGWHYLPVKNKSYFYCLNCLYSFRTENKLKSHEKVCKNFLGIVMSLKKDKIL